MNNISKEVKLLVRNHIDTAEQLSLYKKGLEVQINELTDERKALHDKLRTIAVRDSPEEKQSIHLRIESLNEKLKGLRHEIHLCDDIADRSGVIAQKLKTVRKDEKKTRKEAKEKSQEKDKEMIKK